MELQRALPDYAANGIAVSAAANSQINVAISRDAGAGALLAWQDNRSGNYDIYAHHLLSFGLDSGWPADGVLFATVASINGLKNQETSQVGVSPPDAKFLRVLTLMRKLQLSGSVGMRTMGR